MSRRTRTYRYRRLTSSVTGIVWMRLDPPAPCQAMLIVPEYRPLARPTELTPINAVEGAVPPVGLIVNQLLSEVAAQPSVPPPTLVMDRVALE